MGWSLLLLLMATTIYLSSYTFVWQSYNPAQETIATNPDLLEGDTFEDLLFPTAQNSYFIDNLDGTYDFYLDNVFWETVDTLEYHLNDIPVYTADTAPQGF